MLTLLLACGPLALDSVATNDTGAHDTAAVDTADSAASDTGTPVDTGTSIHGHWAVGEVPAPEFMATNRDGTARSRPDLIGHPTVVWFYPAAATSG